MDMLAKRTARRELADPEPSDRRSRFLASVLPTSLREALIGVQRAEAVWPYVDLGGKEWWHLRRLGLVGETREALGWRRYFLTRLGRRVVEIMGQKQALQGE